MKAAMFALCALVLGCSAPGHDADDGDDAGDDGKADGVSASDELFDPAHLPRFELELPAESISALTTDPHTYVKATFRYGTEVVDNVGVRLKGNRSFRRLDQKAAFKIKFDAFVEQSFRGLKGLTLNNAVGDPSFVAERIAYTAFRAAGVPAPRANNAVVTVNGNLYGVYVNVETLDKRFLKRWYESNDGNLYESEFVDLDPSSVDLFELKTNEDANDRSDLTGLVTAMTAAPASTMLTDLEPVLDTAEFLKFCALEAIVNQWDGYGYFGDQLPNNFHLYHDPSSGQFTFIPWGMDAALKARRGLTGTEYMYVFGVHSWLLARCVSDETCRASYAATVQEVATLFESLMLDVRAQKMADQIRDAVHADPRKEFDNATFEAMHAKVVEQIRLQPGRVRADVAE